MVTYRLKKIISFLIILAFISSNLLLPVQNFHSVFTGTTVSAATQKTKWPAAPSLYGQSAILIEASTGTILYEKKSRKKMYPASITKIMTALLTLENCSLDETVIYSENAIKSLEYGDANAECQIGEKMSVKDCLYALMLTSANETATALGEHIAGSIDKFADMMNERAAQAGAEGVHFTNANGLHDKNHYVTAYGMAMIMRDALHYDTFKDIINTSEYTIKKNNKRKKPFYSIQRHKMVREYSGYYYDGIIGGKTGFTNESGTTLVTAAERDGMTLIAVVLNSNGDHVYLDTAALFDYGFKNFHMVNVSENDTRFKNDDTLTFKSPFTTSYSSICIDKDSDIVVPKKVKFSKLTSEISFGLSDNGFATITYKYGSKELGTANIKYTNTTAEPETETTTLETGASENTSSKDAVTQNSSTSAESITTSSDTQNITTAAQNNNAKKTTFKIPKILLPIIVSVVVVIIIIIIIILQRRKLNRIRAMKRQRNRD